MTRALGALGVAAVVAAAVFAGWGAVSWFSAATDDGLHTAEARDEALRQGRDRVAELTTMDHTDVEAGVRRWLDATTGKLHAELEDTDPATLTAVEQAGTVATGTVLHAALSEFDADHGRATLLASVEITTARDGAEPAYTRTRYRAQLRHTGDAWKVESFETVPVGGAE
jgi:Mce-associated membrane protein